MSHSSLYPSIVKHLSVGKTLGPTCESRRNLLGFGICERVEAWARKSLCKGSLAPRKLRCICYLENSEGSPRKSIALGVDVGKCWPNHLKIRCHLSNSISLTFQYIFIFVEFYALSLLHIFCLALYTFRSALLIVRAIFQIWVFIDKGETFLINPIHPPSWVVI